MNEQDKERFCSFADAQVSLTNQIYDYLNKPKIFLFCPTGLLKKFSCPSRRRRTCVFFQVYCSRMAKPSLERCVYLQTIGNGLHPDIDVFWTGKNYAYTEHRPIFSGSVVLRDVLGLGCSRARLFSGMFSGSVVLGLGCSRARSFPGSVIPTV